VKGFAVLATLSVLSLLVHTVLAGALSGVDLVDALLVHASPLHAAMAAVLLATRVFLIFVAPAWSLASSLSALAARK
jgi:hypothetical protein